MTTIMLVEDDQTMVSLLQTLLGMEGYQVSALDMKDDILEAVRIQQPDILLLDVHLPTVNGLDVIDQIRSFPDTRAINVVMTSGLDLEAECLRHGANEFLLKPYMPDDLLAILRRTASSASHADS